MKKTCWMPIYIYIYIYILGEKKQNAKLGEKYMWKIYLKSALSTPVLEHWRTGAQNSFIPKVSSRFLWQDSKSSHSFGKIQNLGVPEISEKKRFGVSLEDYFI